MKVAAAFRQMTLVLLSLAGLSNAQVSNSLGVWVDHLPYGQAVDIESVGDDAIVAARQGIFIYNISEKNFRRLSKVNGLTDVGITDIAWAPRFKEILIGYENGNFDIATMQGNVSNFPDLKLSSNFSGLKRINTIKVLGDTALIATEFGILNFDLQQRVVRETFIIGPNGSNLGVNDIAFDKNRLYAATPDGLYSASFEDPLFFFASWQKDSVITQPLSHVAQVGNRLFVNKIDTDNSDSIYYRENAQWFFFDEQPVGRKNDLRESRGNLVVVNNFSAREFNQNLEMVTNVSTVDESEMPTYNPVAAAVRSDQLFWVADANFGLVEHFQKQFSFNHRPNSPKSRDVRQMRQAGDKLYVAPANTSGPGAPVFNNDGFFILSEFEWENIPNQQFNDFKDIHAIIADPDDPDHIYASSFGNGVLEFQDNELQRVIDQNSTGGALPGLNGENGHRVGDFDVDADGNIWFTNSLTDRILGKIDPDGNVESFSTGSAGAGDVVSKIMVTSENQIWIQTRTQGIIVAQFENGRLVSRELTSTAGEGDLPSNDVKSFAEDQDGEIWIGTNEGIAVIFSPANIFENNRNFDASIIVIDEDGDGNGDRVLGSESINDIEVDGGNKKWFATTNSGVFYTSENGRQQLQRFTAENSPLPSNNVVDIEIDDNTGMVYFGTAEGIVGFQGSATEGVEVMTDVFAYPNPVEPDYDGPILIRGLVTNAQVKITDMQGSIVFETVAEGGQAIWNGKDFSGERVSSGVYLAYITDDLGVNTEVTKILVVN
mgnify:CR=1 FL=1